MLMEDVVIINEDRSDVQGSCNDEIVDVVEMKRLAPKVKEGQTVAIVQDKRRSRDRRRSKEQKPKLVSKDDPWLNREADHRDYANNGINEKTRFSYNDRQGKRGYETSATPTINPSYNERPRMYQTQNGLPGVERDSAPRGEPRWTTALPSMQYCPSYQYGIPPPAKMGLLPTPTAFSSYGTDGYSAMPINNHPNAWVDFSSSYKPITPSHRYTDRDDQEHWSSRSYRRRSPSRSPRDLSPSPARNKRRSPSRCYDGDVRRSRFDTRRSRSRSPRDLPLSPAREEHRLSRHRFTDRDDQEGRRSRNRHRRSHSRRGPRSPSPAPRDARRPPTRSSTCRDVQEGHTSRSVLRTSHSPIVWTSRDGNARGRERDRNGDNNVELTFPLVIPRPDRVRNKKKKPTFARAIPAPNRRRKNRRKLSFALAIPRDRRR